MTETSTEARADTPVRQPPSRLESIKSLLGDLARPFAIYAIAAATGAAIIGQATADKVGAAGLILAALYGAKTIEVREQTRQAASVEIAKAASPTA